MSERDWRNDPATPANLQATERGRRLEPAYLVGRVEFDITPAHWEHVERATFGPARKGPNARPSEAGWTGNSYRYDLYRYVGADIFLKGTWALRWSHGGGDGWYVADGLPGECTLFEIIAGLPIEARRWDACHAICKAVESTATEESRTTATRYGQAFVDGRLKKRKKNGSYRVEIVPKELATQES